MIGGVDLVLPGRTRNGDADFILRGVRELWPLAYIQRADSEESAPLSTVRFPLSGLSEFFVYRDSTSMESWQRHGAMPGNEDSMIHVIVSDRDATIVVDTSDGPLASAVEEIFDGLRAKRMMPRSMLRAQQVSHDITL